MPNGQPVHSKQLHEHNVGFLRLSWRKILKGLFLVVTVLFVGRYFYANLGQTLQYEWSLRYEWLLISTISLLAVYAGQAVIWRAVLLKVGTQISILPAAYVYFFGLLSTYIPGRVWGPVGIIASASERGVPPSRSITVTFFSTGISLFAATIVSLSTVVGYGGITGFGLLWLLSIVVVGCLLCFPRLTVRIVNWALEMTGQSPIRPVLRGLDVLVFLSGYVVTWIIYGVALYLFARAIGHAGIGTLPRVVGANATAYVAGYMAFFTPAGLGVREVVLSETLRQLGSGREVVWLAVLSRLWLVVGQLLGFLTVTLALRLQPLTRSHKPGAGGT